MRLCCGCNAFFDDARHTYRGLQHRVMTRVVDDFETCVRIRGSERAAESLVAVERNILRPADDVQGRCQPARVVTRL